MGICVHKCAHKGLVVQATGGSTCAAVGRSRSARLSLQQQLGDMGIKLARKHIDMPVHITNGSPLISI